MIYNELVLIQSNITELNEKTKEENLFEHYSFLVFAFAKLRLPKKLDKTVLNDDIAFFIISDIKKETRLEGLSPIMEKFLFNASEESLFIMRKNEQISIKISKPEQINEVIKLLPKKSLKLIKEKIDKNEESGSTLFHLSDLHLGSKAIVKNVGLLKDTLKEKVKNNKVDFVVTGDLCDSPNPQNIEKYADFKGFLEKISHHEVIMVPGNHDVDASGIAVTRGARNLFSSFQKYPDITLLEENKIALLLFNSNEPDGKLALAKGKIGKEQMLQMDNELNLLGTKINIKEYRLVALLHHHIAVIPSPKQYKGGLIRKVLYNEKTQTLVDKDEFIKWLKENNVHLVLHGHRHVPYITSIKDIDVVSAGSSTGNIELKKKEKMFITFNVINTNSNIVIQYFVTHDGEEEAIIRPLKSFMDE